MSHTTSDVNGSGTVHILLAINLLPLVGIGVFEWTIYQALFVYWIEVGLALVAYFGLVLFAGAESKPEHKRGGSYPGPVPFPPGSRSVQPLARMPPIRAENVRYVPAAFVLVSILWFLSFRVFVEYPNVGLDTGEEIAVLTYLDAAYTPEGVATAVALVGVRVLFLRRDYLERGLLDRHSAAMLMGIPCRIAIYWFSVLVVLSIVSLLQGATGTAPSLAAIVIATGAVVAKLAADRALVRSRTLDAPGWFDGLFAPNEREQGYEIEAARDWK